MHRGCASRFNNDRHGDKQRWVAFSAGQDEVIACQQSDRGRSVIVMANGVADILHPFSLGRVNSISTVLIPRRISSFAESFGLLLLQTKNTQLTIRRRDLLMRRTRPDGLSNSC